MPCNAKINCQFLKLNNHMHRPILLLIFLEVITNKLWPSL